MTAGAKEVFRLWKPPQPETLLNPSSSRLEGATTLNEVTKGPPPFFHSLLSTTLFFQSAGKRGRLKKNVAKIQSVSCKH